MRKKEVEPLVAAPRSDVQPMRILQLEEGLSEQTNKLPVVKLREVTDRLKEAVEDPAGGGGVS